MKQDQLNWDICTGMCSSRHMTAKGRCELVHCRSEDATISPVTKNFAVDNTLYVKDRDEHNIF